MRRFSKLAAIAAGLVVASIFSSAANATDYTWTNLAGGTTAWDLASNWGGAGFPNAQGDKGDLNVGITSNLGVNLANNFTLTTLVLGSSTNAVTTDIGNANSTGNGLIFDNGTSGTSFTIFSRGVAGVNNIISAPIYIGLAGTASSTLSIGSTDNAVDPLLGQRSLTLNGIVQPLGADRVLTNNLKNGAALTINGNIVLSGANDTNNVIATSRRLTIVGANTGSTIINGKFLAGTLPLAGITGASGPINLGLTSTVPTSVPLADTQPHTYTLNAVNTAFTGNIVLNRGTFVLNGADALGVGEFRGGNPSGPYGFNLVAGTDNYQVNASFRTVQNMTLRGENSFIFNKVVFGTQNRAFVNLLPEGKTVTMTQAYYTAANVTDSRSQFFDGTGTTIMNVGVRNYWNGSTTSPLDDNAGNGGSIVQRGTGKLIINGTGSTLRGYAMASGGLLEFASDGSYGVQADNGTGNPNVGVSAMFTNPGGAVGVRTGSLNPSFLNLFVRDFPSPFGNFNDSAGNQVNSKGAIALATADAATNIDFNSGDFISDRLKGVSIGALSSGVTYTGTITPGADNTYRLGGGGTLTMANANALTGARNLEVVNGGTVVLAQANNFSGTTTVQGVWVATGLENAQISSPNVLQTYTDAGGVARADRVVTGVRISPTLEVKKLDDVNGSSLASTSAIRLRGATLKYSGSTNDSTTKTLTIGSAGATLDSSGSGSITFANAAAATQEDQADLTSAVLPAGNSLTTANGGSINFGNSDPLATANLGLGWTVAGPGIPTTATINGLATNSNAGPSNQTGIVVWLKNDGTTSFTASPGGSTYTFTNQSRTLTLTGSSTGNNTVANALTDSAKGKLAISKTGAGKWNLSGNNSYTGATTVNAGTLALGSVNALGATSSTTVKSGATLAIATPSSTAVKIDNAKLTRESGSKLDMLHGKLVLDYTGASPLATVKADIISGYAGGAFNGNGITTSDTVAGKKLRVGYAEATQINTGGTWFGQSVDADAILLAGTFAGDTDLNGVVDFDDLLKLAQNYNGTGKNWVDGDSDYNGTIDFDDLLSLAQSYNAALLSVDMSGFNPQFNSDFALAMSLVPEPVSFGSLAALALVGGRRRRD